MTTQQFLHQLRRMTEVRYNKRVRRFLRWLSHHIFQEQILDYLYPDDMMITFKEPGNE